MHVAIVGSGYVGTTLAAGLADAGHRVTAVDIDPDVVAALNAGKAWIHEPGLDDLLARTAGDELSATTDYEAIANADVIFIAVQTPSRADGSIDIGALRAATQQATETVANARTRADDGLVVIKSTVTPPQLAELGEEVAGIDGVELAANPEFLREGSAVEDFHAPDKVVFGVTSKDAERRLRAVFEPIIASADPDVIVTDPKTAAMIKYANNAFLAAKISLINDLGNICKEFGIDAYEVAEAIGADHRIGDAFLRSGLGFGGSCFPKDVRAIQAAATAAGYDAPMLHATMAVNDTQPDRMIELLASHVDLEAARIAVLGLAFKPGTDDIRNSRAIPVIQELQARGADVVTYDPVATDDMRKRFPDVEYASSAKAALEGADGAVITTDWDEFAALDDAFDAMANPVVVDGRRIIERRDGITYEGLTW